jgi:hypothetical protein
MFNKELTDINEPIFYVIQNIFCTVNHFLELADIQCERFEVLTVVIIKISVFCDVMPWSLVHGYYCFQETTCLPEDGGSRFLQNVCTHLLKYIASYYRS